MNKISCGKCAPCLQFYPEKCIQLQAPKKLRKGDADWGNKCVVCQAVPVVYTGEGSDCCGPCTFGESETAGGNW